MDLTDIVVAAAISGEGGGGADQIQSDWNQTDTTAKDFIKNKPIIPAETPIATTEIAGKVKPDGTTINVNSNGAINTVIPAPPTSDGQYVLSVVDGAYSWVSVPNANGNSF